MPAHNRRVLCRTGLAIMALGLLPGCAVPSIVGPARLPRVGYLSANDAGDRATEAFRQGLADHDRIEGRNILVEYRFADRINDRLRDLAADLIKLPVDVLVVGGAEDLRAAAEATRTIPIVFAFVGDPVVIGAAARMARPGGNMTGLSNISSQIAGKQLEVIAATVPGASRVAILVNPENPVHAQSVRLTEEPARALGLQVHLLEGRSVGALIAAFAAARGAGADALLVHTDPLFPWYQAPLAELGAAHRMPTMFSVRDYPIAGGLMSYGPDRLDMFRRAASYVDKILKGAKPADLPIEQPTTFDFVINQKTAHDLGLTIPPSVLAQVTDVIQ